MCQDWPSAMHDHMSTPLNISMRSDSKSAVKAFRLIFAKRLTASKITMNAFSSPSSISSRTLIGHSCVCKWGSGIEPHSTGQRRIRDPYNLFAVVLEASLVSCAPECVLWYRQLHGRGWFSTGERCSVKWSRYPSGARCALLCIHKPVCVCVCGSCHHGFEHTVLPIIPFGQGHTGTNNILASSVLRATSLWCAEKRRFLVRAGWWCRYVVKIQKCMAHLHRTLRNYMHLDEYIH